MTWRKILIYQRHALDREAARRALSSANMDAEVVEDTPAFEKALEWWKPDAVMCGITFEGFSGGDLITALRARNVAQPLFLIGARTEGALRELAQACGAHGAFSTLRGYADLPTWLRTRAAELDAPAEDDDGSTGW